MIFNDQAALKARVEELAGRMVMGRIETVTDTTNYMNILGGMVLRLSERDYFITGDAREGRFGIDDQPKFWVKYAWDLETGARKIIKLVFYEDFTTRQGAFLIKASRSPEKESHCLEIVEGHPRFMQGFSVNDSVGNLVRVIEFIRGKSLYVELFDLKMDHEQYFHEVFPGLLSEIIAAVEAIKFLHDHGEEHGDIRNDHLFHDPETGIYRWIDFDYRATYSDYDILSLGNIITYAVAKRIVTFKEVIEHPEHFGCAQTCSLTADDAMLFYKYRIANLQKLFPYIPDKLNRVLMNFSAGTYLFYERYEDLITDLSDAAADLG